MISHFQNTVPTPDQNTHMSAQNTMRHYATIWHQLISLINVRRRKYQCAIKLTMSDYNTNEGSQNTNIIFIISTTKSVVLRPYQKTNNRLYQSLFLEL